MKRITKLVLEDTKRRTSGQPTASTKPAEPSAAIPSIPDMMMSSGPVSQLPRTGAAADDGWNTGRHGAGSVTVADPAVASKSNSGPISVSANESGPIKAGAIGPSRASTSRDNAASVVSAQKSTRIRRRQRSLFDRLFGWLFGR
jgi:hypothetical protein